VVPAESGETDANIALNAIRCRRNTPMSKAVLVTAGECYRLTLKTIP
jgi:hypothetical protein